MKDTVYAAIFMNGQRIHFNFFFFKKKHHTGLKKTINQLLVEDLEEKKIITNA